MSPNSLNNYQISASIITCCISFVLNEQLSYLPHKNKLSYHTCHTDEVISGRFYRNKMDKHVKSDLVLEAIHRYSYSGIAHYHLKMAQGFITKDYLNTFT